MKIPPLLKSALALWAIPLVTGIAIFTTFVVTRVPGLIEPALFILDYYPIVTLAGIACVAVFLWKARLSGALPKAWRPARTVLWLLLSNVAIAEGIFGFGRNIYPRYEFVVRNHTAETIESFRLDAAGAQAELGPIAPGATAAHRFRLKGNGGVKFRARQGNRAFKGDSIEEYVTMGLGGKLVVDVAPGGAWTIRYGND